MFIPISNSDSRPLYEQVFDGIKDKIYQGELNPGDMLPSIREMAKELKISVITVKRAYFELERQGFIITRPGKGSYIANFSLRDIHKAKRNEVYQRMKAIALYAREARLSQQEFLDIVNKVVREEF